MYSRFLTSSIYGLTGENTWVEVDSENGLPSVSIVGLADQSVKEAKDRIRSAITNIGYSFPARKITINLSPANKQKNGSHYDLPIALGVLNSAGLLLLKDKKQYREGKTAFLGELTLDGRLNYVEGLIPMLIGFQRDGIENVIIPLSNLKESGIVKNIRCMGAADLKQVIDYINGNINLESAKCEHIIPYDDTKSLDFADIKGQESAKRAAMVAAAGLHGMLMIGAPGVGKSMIGKRIPGILPEMSYDEQLDSTQIYSAAGKLSDDYPMIVSRPFRNPHHTISNAALIGGGHIPKPGEISLAHNGVLFLDELPEFSPRTLDMLRQPMEDGFITISRANYNVIFPSSFMLVAGMNPCKCGFYNDPVKVCTCSEGERKRYLGRVSGPLLDRIDIHISLRRMVYSELTTVSSGLDTASMKNAVAKAVIMQKDRYKHAHVKYNSQLTSEMIGKYCELDKDGEIIMSDAFTKWDLSARAYHKILKIARTIADLDGSESIKPVHILEALSYRMPDGFYEN